MGRTSEPPRGPDSATGHGGAGPAVTMEAMRQDFLDFFDAEYPLVVRFVMRNGASLEVAEDAAQEAFERGWRKVRSGRWQQISHPRAWIRQVALNRYRGHRGSPEPTAVPTGQAPETPEPGPGHAELTGQALDVVAALRLIEDGDARAVIALDMDGISGPAIAEMLGLSEQKVRDLRKRARRTLRRALAPSMAPRGGSPLAASEGEEGR